MKLTSKDEIKLCVEIIRQMYLYEFTNTTKELKDLIEDNFSNEETGEFTEVDEKDLEEFCNIDTEEQILIYKNI